MVYDSRRERMLLHGGRSGTGRSGASLGDTWAWDGTRWAQLDTSKGPSGRDHHRMAYDRARDRVVLFGGWDGERVVGDTWEWDGSEWREMAIEGSGSPDPRAPFGLVYDEAREEVLLFGGRNLERSFGDTWRWRGEGWERLEPEVGLPPRAFHGATYDPDADRILVFGGRDDETVLSDTWAWNGSRWLLLSEDGPTRRGIYALAYDRRRNVALFHGSGTNEDGRWHLSDETWLWDGDRWRVSSR